MSQKPPTNPHQQFNIDKSAIEESQIGGQAGRDLTQNQGSGNIFKDVTFNIFGGQKEAQTTGLSRREYRNRQALLNKVNNFWIKGVLEASLHNQVQIELGLEESPDATDSPWSTVLETLEEEQKSLPQGTSVIDIFNQLGEGRTLLILGEPGSGKTITLLQLARDLIARAEQDINHLIPVVFNLSSWAGEKQTIAEWLVQELNAKYQVPKKVGQTWVKEEQLLLLLDGLDEVQAKHREACVSALNQFHQNFGSPEIVICCRKKDYFALSRRLNFQSGINLRSLSLEQVYHYLERAGSNLAGLKSLIVEDQALQELAQSPLMFNIMAMAYQGVAVEDMPAKNKKIHISTEEHRQQLFNAYIERMFKRRRSREGQYSKSQTKHWLTLLAQKMSQSSQTVFLIEGIQPTWLQTAAQQRAYHIGVKLLLIMIWGGIHVGLLAGHRGGNLITFDLYNNLQGLTVGLIGGLIYGVVGGLLSGLVKESTNHLIGRLINGLLLGGIFGPIFGWLYGRSMYGLAYALIYGMIGIFTYGPIHFSQTIEPINALKWSWRKARNYSVFGLIIGLVLGFGTPTPLVPSLVFGLMLSLIFGFERVNEVERKTIPNQSIWQSAANSGKLFVIIGLLTGVILGVIENPTFGIVNGILFGLAAALLGGRGAGIICIKHFTLRFILWRSGAIPWNYAHFLNYASDRIFLQKVGGGYVFVHRLLLEHFAQMKLNVAAQ